MKSLTTLAAVLSIAALSSNALAAETIVRKQAQLISKEGTVIVVTADVAESETLYVKDGHEYKNRSLRSFSAVVSGTNVNAGSKAQVVLVLECGALHYPNSWSYRSESVLDLTLNPSTSALYGQEAVERRLERVSGTDHDSCRAEIAVVLDGTWQTDPVSGSHNFIPGF